jgi:hypothetical protein
LAKKHIFARATARPAKEVLHSKLSWKSQPEGRAQALCIPRFLDCRHEKVEKNEAHSFIPGGFFSGADGGSRHIGRAAE